MNTVHSFSICLMGKIRIKILFFLLLAEKPFDFRIFWYKMVNKWEIVVKSGSKWV